MQCGVGRGGRDAGERPRRVGGGGHRAAHHDVGGAGPERFGGRADASLVVTWFPRAADPWRDDGTPPLPSPPAAARLRSPRRPPPPPPRPAPAARAARPRRPRPRHGARRPRRDRGRRTKSGPSPRGASTYRARQRWRPPASPRPRPREPSGSVRPGRRRAPWRGPPCSGCRAVSGRRKTCLPPAGAARAPPPRPPPCRARGRPCRRCTPGRGGRLSARAGSALGKSSATMTRSLTRSLLASSRATRAAQRGSAKEPVPTCTSEAPASR